MTSLARFAVRRPLIVLLLWIAVITGVQTAAVTAGSDYRNEFTLSGTDSQAAADLLADRFPEMSGDTDRIVWRVEDGTATGAAAIRVVHPLLDRVGELGIVTEALPPAAGPGPAQVSADGRTAFATVQYSGPAVELPLEQIEELAVAVEEADDSWAGGELAIGGQGVSRLSAPEIGPLEIVGLLFAAAVLFLAFGSATAMLLPIVSAVAALAVGLGIVSLLSTAMTISDVAPVLGVLLGLGVGIDYALFVVNRFRNALAAGEPVDQAVVLSIKTSGRAVVFAGITVCLALAGMFVPGISFLYGIAVGAAVAVLCTVASAVTLLPALLLLLGRRVLGRRIRRRLASGGATGQDAAPFFAPWARLVRRRPVALGLLALAALTAVAAPALDLRLGTADQGNDPRGTTTRQAYDLLAEGFGAGFNGPLLVTVDLRDDPLPPTSGPPQTPGGAPAVPTQLEGLHRDLADDPGVATVVGPLPSPDGTAAVLQVIPRTSPQDEATAGLLERIRGSYAPAQDAEVHVGGAVATFDDFADEVFAALPLFLGVVIGLSFLLLVVAFRSLLVPVVGAVLNLLSAGAAFGVVVAVFQWGWAADLLGVGAGGPIEPFIPIILFALLFGLSMDYQVFLVSRIAEEWHATSDNDRAVTIGHAQVGKVIVAAAAIMVFVFGGFAFGDSRTIKLMGLGMASAILLDALVLRMIVVPAVMHRLGPANWWIPRWLDRVLPRVSIEGAGPSGTLPPADGQEPAGTGEPLASGSRRT